MKNAIILLYRFSGTTANKEDKSLPCQPLSATKTQHPTKVSSVLFQCPTGKYFAPNILYSYTLVNKKNGPDEK